MSKAAFSKIESGLREALAVATGWHEWAGGPCPVHPDVFVHIRLDDGYVLENQIAGRKFWEAGKERGQQIVAYRISDLDAWHGGDCPAAPDSFVEVKTNVWPETITAQAKHWYLGARDWWQAHPEPLARIVAWRAA